jgi:hypothetical protein
MAFATSAMREAYNGKSSCVDKEKSRHKNRNYRWKKKAAIIASTDLHHLLKQIRRIYCRCWRWKYRIYVVF